MNVSNNSECSNGCESGWTMYWNQLSNNSTSDLYTADFATQSKLGYYQQQQEEGDEDLSMVSDASSAAPPHLKHAALPEYIKKKSKNKITRKQKETRPDYNKKQNHHSFCLDDTATSSIFHFSQDEPKPKKQLGFFKSCNKGKSGSLMGRKRQ
ncbi:PREDICTED: uncharacterized protein LOC105971365 [Erythranthe guttata]|uniref:uncharacterized protein LOC105971365 n=1 Tax=Erythranthe guttata TaxID=4155 RepID=UPI00064DC192|nr:PREDICTED: uncharacterized protein LOC105971365 [Erythranthe guttata]|eukprot:XP_012851668.1 PREDICTED: uncharacterized protein LOC105971365 [Erythranthe guttata]